MKPIGDAINSTYSDYDFDCSKDVGYENQSFHYDYNDENHINSEVEKLIRLLESSDIESINHKKLVAIIGITGVGKSTLLNLLAKKKLKAEKNEDDDWAIGVENPIAKISHSYVSETTIPNKYYDAENDLFFIDFAGLLDSKGVVQRIYNSYYMKTILSDKDVQFLLVIKPDSLTSSRGKIFKEDIVDVIHKLFDGGFGYIKGSLSIVISHAKPNEDSGYYINKMKSILKEETTESSRQFTDYITKYNKISLFYQEDTTKYADTRKNIIKNINESPYKQNAKINYAFGIEDELVLANSFEKCQKSSSKLISDVESEIIKNLNIYISKLTNNFSNDNPDILLKKINNLNDLKILLKEFYRGNFDLNKIDNIFDKFKQIFGKIGQNKLNIEKYQILLKKYRSHIDFVESINSKYSLKKAKYELKNLDNFIENLDSIYRKAKELHKEKLRNQQKLDEMKKIEEEKRIAEEKILAEKLLCEQQKEKIILEKKANIDMKIQSIITKAERLKQDYTDFINSCEIERKNLVSQLENERLNIEQSQKLKIEKHNAYARGRGGYAPIGEANRLNDQGRQLEQNNEYEIQSFKNRVQNGMNQLVENQKSQIEIRQKQIEKEVDRLKTERQKLETEKLLLTLGIEMDIKKLLQPSIDNKKDINKLNACELN